jgi:quinol monooxygenase YgiN
VTAKPSPPATNIVAQYDGGELRAGDGSLTIDWTSMLESLEHTRTWWLTVVSGTGLPRTRPVFAVISRGEIYIASGDSAVKTRLLDGRRPCSLAASASDLDVVWSGHSFRVVDRSTLEALAGAYRSAYGWEVTAQGEALESAYGAPTAGPPPCRVFRIDPSTVHAFGTSDELAPRSTRWDLRDPVDASGEVVVVGHIAVQPGSRDEYLRGCESVVRAARATGGCIDYALGPDLLDPDRINVVERWSDRASLEEFRAGGPTSDQMDVIRGIRVAELRVSP